MYRPITFPLLATLALSSSMLAQDETPKPTTPVLTQQQLDSIVKQLADVEKSIAKERGTNVGTILQKLRSATSSDAAAMALYEDCKLLNADRKALTRDDKKAREDEIKKQSDLNREKKVAVVKEDGDFGTAVRLQIRYIIMTLEAKDAKAMENMHPELVAYLQDVAASAEKLKGRSGAYLANSLKKDGARRGVAARRAGGGGGGGGADDLDNPFVRAFQLDHFLENDNWSVEPLAFGDIFEKAVLPTYRANKKSELAAQWDARMSAEAGYRKGAFSEAEYALWQGAELLDIKWLKLKDVYANGDKPVNAMAEMLAMIRENPGHAASPKWLEEFRGIVAAAAPGATRPPPAVAP